MGEYVSPVLRSCRPLADASFGAALVFDDPQFRGFELAVPEAPVRGKIKLKPGTYTIYCSIPGHRQAGEQATITAV